MIQLAEPQLKRIFWIMFLFLAVVCLIVTPHYGITGDEVTQWQYGTFVWKYIKTFGADKGVLTDPSVADSPLKYYGGFFDGVGAMLIDIFRPKDEFLLRHYWNVLFGLAGLLFGGLLAKELAGWRAAIITLIFLIFTPRFFGEIFNNPKDIPFATGYLISLYCIIRWLRRLEKPDWKTTIWLGLSLALAISVRVGGILNIAYLGLFYAIGLWRARNSGTGIFGRSFLHLIVAVVIGWVGACLWWPFALEDIFNNPIEAVRVMSAYPLNVTMLFDGAKIRTADVPPGYLLKWISIGTPLLILLGFIGALAFLVRWSRARKDAAYWLLLFATVFPVFYIIYKKSVVYDGMRHILFVLPLISLFAALFVDYLLTLFRDRKPVRYAVAGLTLILLFLPARFMFANHPNEYVYFNELTGGIKGAYGNYEMDYYFNSMKEAFSWLEEHKLKGHPAGKDSITVASNVPGMLIQYQKLSPVPFRFVYVRYYQRNEHDWDYGVFAGRFLDREQLQNGYFPGDRPLHVVTADGVPLTAVVENDPERNGFKAQELMKKGQDTLAVPYLEAAVRKYPTDAENWRNLAIAAFRSGNKQRAGEAIDRAYAISSLDLSTANTAGMLYMQTGNINKAMEVFSKMTEDYPDAAEGLLGLGQAQAAQGNFALAIENLNKSMELDPGVSPQAYMVLAYIYQQKGDMATAQKYAQAAQSSGR